MRVSSPAGLAALARVRTARRRVDAAQSEIDAARRELRDAVGAAVDAGATKADVARFLGITRTTLYAYLNRPGPE